MIYGSKIRLRAVEKEDLPNFVAWLNDPEVREGLMIYLPFSLVEEEAWFSAMLSRPAEEHPLVIEVKHEGRWQAIGNCGIHNIDWRSRSASVGILIGEKKWWNKGVGTNAMRLLLDHGFGTLNLNRIWLRVYEDNPRAIRSYEKVGFVNEGREREGHYKEGRYIDVLVMSMLRREWKHIKDRLNA